MARSCRRCPVDRGHRLVLLTQLLRKFRGDQSRVDAPAVVGCEEGSTESDVPDASAAEWQRRECLPVGEVEWCAVGECVLPQTETLVLAGQREVDRETKASQERGVDRFALVRRDDREAAECFDSDEKITDFGVDMPV